MIIKKINDNLSITGEVYSNSNAWGHEVRAIYHGHEVAKNRVRYHNRTWESYQFQSAWEGLLSKLDNDKIIPILDRIEFAKAVR